MHTVRSSLLLAMLATAAAAVAGCTSTSSEMATSSTSSAVVSSQTSTTSTTSSTSSSASAAPTIPASLAPFGTGYPTDGSPCRRLGESPQTSRWLDDSAILIGCPSEDAAKALNGTVVGVVDGVTIVSIPLGEANPGLSAVPSPAVQTTSIACAAVAAEATSDCVTKVTRKWGEDGTTLVEVTKPDGKTRALFFHGTTPYGADSAQADGSAGFVFAVTRQGDNSVITFGPERYIVPDSAVS